MFPYQLRKEKLLKIIESDISLNEIKNKSIIIVDDVLNTGSTLIYAVSYFLKIPVKKIQTAVMVNRNHKKFPIKADFKGNFTFNISERTYKCNIRRK